MDIPFILADLDESMKKLLLIYRSGAQTTVEYDESEKTEGEDLYHKITRNMINLKDKTIVWMNGVSIKVDQIDHMEILK